MAIAGQIEYKVSVDTSGLKAGLDSAKKEASKFGSTLASIGKSGAKMFSGALIAGAATATTAIIGIGQSAVKSYADYEQLTGGIETLFGKSADAMLEYANKAYETAGLSANKYMEQATAFSASLLQSLGGDAKEASRITDMAIKDMADNANKMGSSIDSIQNAYQGFAKQNYTMLDNLKLGYGGTKTEMERLLADAQKMTGVHYDISNLDDVFSAIHAIQGELGITGTTAEEASSTITGSLNMMKASWANLMTGIAGGGGDVSTMVDNFVKSLKTFISNVMPVARTAMMGAVELISELAPMFIEELANMLPELLPAIIEATVMLMQALVENLPTIMQVFIDNIPLLVDGLVQIVMALIPYLPQILILLVQAVITTTISLIQSFAPHIGEAFKHLFDGFGKFFEGVLGFFGDFATGATKAFGDFANAISKGLNNIGAWFRDTFQGVWDFVTGVFNGIGDFFAGVWDRIASIFNGIGQAIGDTVSGAFKAVINHILGFIENFVNTPINILNGFLGVINDAFGWLGVNISKIGTISLPRMATGGIVPSTAGGQLIVAGEGGQDEWVVPESKMASLMEQIQERSEGLGNVTINVYGTFATSEEEQRNVAEQIYEKLQEINKSRMGVYL